MNTILWLSFQAQSALSEDLCEVYQRYNQTATTGALCNRRMLFLRRAIEGCVQRLPEIYMPEELIECQACMVRLLDLAHSWDIDNDIVNREYVVCVTIFYLIPSFD